MRRTQQEDALIDFVLGTWFAELSGWFLASRAPSVLQDEFFDRFENLLIGLVRTLAPGPVPDLCDVDQARTFLASITLQSPQELILRIRDWAFLEIQDSLERTSGAHDSPPESAVRVLEELAVIHVLHDLVAAIRGLGGQEGGSVSRRLREALGEQADNDRADASVRDWPRRTLRILLNCLRATPWPKSPDEERHIAECAMSVMGSDVRSDVIELNASLWRSLRAVGWTESEFTDRFRTAAARMGL